MKKINNPKSKKQNKSSPIIEELDSYYNFMSERNLVHLEIKKGDTKYKLVNQHENNKSFHENSAVINYENKIKPAENKQEILSNNTIKSPMVGTAYLSPEPNTKTFISKGELWTTILGGISFVTTAFAPIIVLSPILFSPIILAPA